MLRSLRSARTVLRDLVQCPCKRSRIPALARSVSVCTGCAQRLHPAEAPAATPLWRLQQLPAQLKHTQANVSSRQLCSLTDISATDIARNQDDTWKATFPAVPAAHVDEFSDALLCYGATAVRRATSQTC